MPGAESKLLRCPRVDENARTYALSSILPQRTRKSWTGWRRGGDSNPRDPFESTRVPGVRLKPGSATSPHARMRLCITDSPGPVRISRSVTIKHASIYRRKCSKFGVRSPNCLAHSSHRRSLAALVSERAHDELVTLDPSERPALKLERPARGRRQILHVVMIDRAQIALRLDVHPDRHRHRVTKKRG